MGEWSVSGGNKWMECRKEYRFSCGGAMNSL